jgi:hypothetical protein
MTSTTTQKLPPPSAQAAREVRRDTPLRRARSCYHHLAGVAGVDFLDLLLRRAWLEEDGNINGRVQYRLTPGGHEELSARGVNLDRASTARRMYAFGCLDWTERRLHLGGSLGVAVLQSLCDAGVARRQAGTRAVEMVRPLESWLDGTAPPGA